MLRPITVALSRRSIYTMSTIAYMHGSRLGGTDPLERSLQQVD